MNWIGGQRLPSNTEKWLTRYSPNGAEPSVSFPQSDIIDVVLAFQSAQKAYLDWKKTTIEVRSNFLQTVAQKIEDRSEELAKIQSQDQGMPIRFSRTESLPRTVKIFRKTAECLGDLMPQENIKVDNGDSVQQRYCSIGVVGILTPWSDPLVILARQISAAMAAGNSIILKPSEYAPDTANSMAGIVTETLQEMSLPTGVFNLVHGIGAEVGAALAQHPGVPALSFTGQIDNGREVLRLSSEFLKKVNLQLGGKNSILVFAGVDLEHVAEQIVQNQIRFHSQTCLHGARLMVQDKIQSEFLEHLRAKFRNLRVGSSLDEATDVGPLGNVDQFEKFNRAVSLAVREKGKLHIDLSSSETSKGYFVRPSMVSDLTQCSVLQQEEVIGPFLSLSSFKYQHEAVKLANSVSTMQQAAFVFHPDREKLEKINFQLEAGRIGLNTFEVWPNEAWTSLGSKGLGIGVSSGQELFEFYSSRRLTRQQFP